MFIEADTEAELRTAAQNAVYCHFDQDQSPALCARRVNGYITSGCEIAAKFDGCANDARADQIWLPANTPNWQPCQVDV